jgi:hypothetical protein
MLVWWPMTVKRAMDPRFHICCCHVGICYQKRLHILGRWRGLYFVLLERWEIVHVVNSCGDNRVLIDENAALYGLAHCGGAGNPGVPKEIKSRSAHRTLTIGYTQPSGLGADVESETCTILSVTYSLSAPIILSI